MRSVETMFDRCQCVALSHPLSAATPAPPGLPQPRVKAISLNEQGADSDLYEITLCNHVGTHIDGPQHMRPRKGPLLDWLPAEGWWTGRVAIVDVPCEAGRLITDNDLADAAHGLNDCELLLVRTGASAWRGLDDDRYDLHNPGLGRDAAKWVCHELPKVRCVGIDSISIASMDHLDEGVAAHHVFFDRDPPVLLLEDFRLDVPTDRLVAVQIVPFAIKGVDSCPCTVLAWLST